MNTPTNQSLRKGAWLEFVYRWSLPGEIMRKILVFIQNDELLMRYLSPIPLNIKDKRVIVARGKGRRDALKRIRETIETKAATGRCHPGRLTLNPEAYHRAFTHRTSPQTISRPAASSRKKKQKKTRRGRTPPFFCYMVDQYQRCGIGARSTTWKHRLLDEEEFNSGRGHPSGRGNAGQGIQDLYFIGGLPLTFWENQDAMGMKFIDPVLRNGAGAVWEGGEHDTTPKAQTAKNRYYQWATEEKILKYELLPHLRDEVTFSGGESSERGQEYLQNERKQPRTLWGGKRWIERHAGGKTPFCHSADGYNDHYVWYIQQFEDTWKASQPPEPEQVPEPEPESESESESELELEACWTREWDEECSRYYWYNYTTEESQWV